MTSITLFRVFGVAAITACATLRPSPTDVSLRVMSYNIQAGGGDLDRVAETIRTAAPELVALQEVDVHWSARSNFVDQAAAIAAKLGMQARFAHIYDLPGDNALAPRREYGVALLSRYPVVAWSNHTLTRLSTQAEGTPPAPMPGLLEATVDVRGTRIRVFSTHLDYRPDPVVRQQQVTEMLAIIGDASVPTLLLGDMNAPPAAPELQPLFERLHDSWTAPTDPGLTYPAAAPVKRIDYVLSSKHFRVRTASVPESQASDHRPVVVDLVVRPPRN